MAAPVKLSNLHSTLLPPTLAGPIFQQTTEESAVMRLARRVPLAMDANTAIPVSMDIPTADWVVEGGAKPVGATGAGIKIMTGKKVALLVPFSEEVVRRNPAGVYDQLRQDLPTSLARAFDYAAIHGKSLRTGAAGPFPEWLKATPFSQELGTTSQANGGMYADLVKGEQQVVNYGFDFSGWAADPKLRPLLKLQVDTQGRPIWVDSPQEGINAGTLEGYPAYFNRGVSGQYLRDGNGVQTVTILGTPTGGTFQIASVGNTATLAYNAAAATVQSAIQAWGGLFSTVTVSGSAGGPYTITFPVTGAAALTANGSGLTGGTSPSAAVAQAGSNVHATGLRAIGGDFGQCAYGVGMDITVKISDEASYVDEGGVTHSAFQENLVLLLVEAYYGFVVGNVNAFVAITDNV